MGTGRPGPFGGFGGVRHDGSAGNAEAAGGGTDERAGRAGRAGHRRRLDLKRIEEADFEEIQPTTPKDERA